MRKSRFFRNGQAVGHGDATGSFNSSSLDYTMNRARDAFLGSLQSLQMGTDPKPYLLTLYGLSLIGDEMVRDGLIKDFEDSLNELEDRFSPSGISICIAAWAGIAEYCGILGTDKKLTVVGDSSDIDDDMVYEQPNPLEKAHQKRDNDEDSDISIVDFDDSDEDEDNYEDNGEVHNGGE